MTIYLIRHAQSECNAVKNPEIPRPAKFDAPISDLGKSQALQARKNVEGLPIKQVIVSPLTRTLQTAELIFGRSFPMIINATIREQLTHSCDVGTSPAKLSHNYTHLDFDHLDDIWWHNEEPDEIGVSVEPDHVLEQRVAEFVAFARQSKLTETAIVTHGNFILTMTGIYPDNCQILEFEV